MITNKVSRVEFGTSTSSGYATKRIAWMRVLTVTFTSQTLKKQLVFGENYLKNEDDLSIDVDCYKYMSSLKDACTIKIDNMTYSDLIQLIQGQYYTVEVKAGYQHGNVMTIFKGRVLYVSNALNDNKTHTAIILCASDVVAKFGQRRLTLSLNSGINLYSAIKFVCKRAGIKNSNVSESFRTKFLNDIMNVNDTPGSWIDKICSNYSSTASNSDALTGSTVSVFDAARNNRVINLNSQTIDLTGGFPRLNSSGLSLTIMPTFAFACGDVIKIDQSLLDLSVTSSSEANKLPGMYLDKDGCYVIIEQHYRLQNRGSQFSLDITGRARSMLTRVASQ